MRNISILTLSMHLLLHFSSFSLFFLGMDASDAQTNLQTKATKNTTSFCQGGNKKILSRIYITMNTDHPIAVDYHAETECISHSDSNAFSELSASRKHT